MPRPVIALATLLLTGCSVLADKAPVSSCESHESTRFGFWVESCEWPDRLVEFTWDVNATIQAYDEELWEEDLPPMSDHVEGYLVSVNLGAGNAFYQEPPTYRIVLNYDGEPDSLHTNDYVAHELWHLYERHEFGFTALEWNRIKHQRHFLVGSFADRMIGRARVKAAQRRPSFEQE